MIKYEYVVTGEYEDGYPVSEVADSRSKARDLKKEFKEIYNCKDSKITQRKFVLQQEKVVR